ncbi:MAG: hypothetical protein Q8L14_07425 [Myxococcales bacterium]|nr:hypothetical protein [Myxococcales bacterium]
MSLQPVPRTPRPRLGEVLVKLGHLNEGQLGQLIARQQQAGGSLGRAAVAAGLCSEEALFSALAVQAELPSVELDRLSQEPEAIGVLPEKFSREHRVVALSLKERVLTVAMTAPASLASQDAVRAVSGRSRVRVVLATDSAMQRALTRFHARAPTPDATPTPVRPPRAPTAVAPLPRPELFDSIGLSARAGELVRQVAISNGLSSREVLQRVIETWAENTLSRKPTQ